MSTGAAEVTFGVTSYGKLLIQSSAKREIELREIFDGELILLEKTIGINNLIKNFIDQNFPYDQRKFNEFIANMDSLGKTETQDIAIKVSKYIWDYKNQGVTMDSIMSGMIPDKAQLQKYTVQKVQKILFGLVNEFVDSEENEDAEIALQEICRLVVDAGYEFFAGNYNRSGDAINGAFTSGIGMVMLFRISDEYERLATMGI